MPMFREDDEGRERSSGPADSQYPDSAPIPIQTPPGLERWLTPRRLSEESIRTDLCEGLAPESPLAPATPERPVAHLVSDRAELIERLKRGESPTWISNRRLESLFHQNKATSPPRAPQPTTSPTSATLLPAPIITPEKQDPTQGPPDITSLLQEGLNIERPRSALHSGNFTPVELSPRAPGSEEDAVGDDSPRRFRPSQDPWISASPPRDYTPFSFEQGAASYRREAFKFAGPSSLSSSLSSNFVYQPPTSPLVQSESNDELDLTLPLNGFNIDANSPRNTRRHTLNLGHSPLANASSHRQPGLRRESTYPYQAHQPRRSLTSTPNFALTGTSPQTPAFFRPRRPSFGSEASPLQHASMVGSYEESILRGRMSTTPSKPLQFMAQIGVLGLGRCKASLRCPAHATLPFSAVFYNYASTSAAGGGSKMEDGPSPYVGQIDLENGLLNPEEGQRAKRKLQSRYQDLKGPAEEGPSAHESPNDVSEGDGIPPKAARAQRPSRSVKAPPGGAYRIPEKGQLQIIIKNPNKTAVKLFLVPYDLTGMEAGTKTFIRQRSYSAGPIIEAEVTTTSKDGHHVPGADRPTLRYLIHLHICCPSKGRYYLYRSIRVVFANRVPDGKEKLRNEVTYPDPRFTPYKPTRVMHPPLLGNALAAPAGASYASSFNINSMPPGAALAAERAFRRRSLGYTAYAHQAYQAPLHQSFQQPPELPPPPMPTSPLWPNNDIANHGLPEPFPEPPTTTMTSPATTMPGLEMTGLPFSFPSPATTPIPTATPIPINTTTTPNSHSTNPWNPAATTTTTTTTPSMTSTPTPSTPTPTLGYSNPRPTYDKLTPGDAGYGGVPTTTGGGRTSQSAAAAEGLLSKRLRSLGVVQQPLTSLPPAASGPGSGAPKADGDAGDPFVS